MGCHCLLRLWANCSYFLPRVKAHVCFHTLCFLFFFFLFYFIFKLYNIVLVLPNIEMNLPQVYLCSPSWTLHLLPPSAPAPSIQYRASNLDWRLVSYMILYMFQCHSAKSYHPHPLPQSPKVCSISVSLLLSRIQGYRYHLSNFHIYVLVYCVGVFLSGLLHSV